MTATTHATAGPLKPGDKVPDFTLKLATKDGVSEFNLQKELAQGQDLVLAFFPMAFSGVCTKEVCDFRDAMPEMSGVKARVFGMSADTHHVNAAFVKMHNLGYGLICDPNHEVLPRIWSTMTVGGVKDRAKRGVMVVGANGVVKWTWSTDDPGQWPGTAEVRKHLG